MTSHNIGCDWDVGPVAETDPTPSCPPTEHPWNFDTLQTNIINKFRNIITEELKKNKNYITCYNFVRKFKLFTDIDTIELDYSFPQPVLSTNQCIKHIWFWWASKSIKNSTSVPNALSKATIEKGRPTHASLTIVDNMGNYDEFCFHHTRMSNFSSTSILDSSKYLSSSFFSFYRAFVPQMLLKSINPCLIFRKFSNGRCFRLRSTLCCPKMGLLRYMLLFMSSLVPMQHFLQFFVHSIN